MEDKETKAISNIAKKRFEDGGKIGMPYFEYINHPDRRDKCPTIKLPEGMEVYDGWIFHSAFGTYVLSK